MTTLISLLILLLHIHTLYAITPSANIDVHFPHSSSLSNYTLYVSQGAFGPYPPMGAAANLPLTPVLPPDEDPLLCQESYGNVQYNETSDTYGNTIMIVPRGDCTFERKALSAQRLGASAMLLYGTLTSRYSINDEEELKWPLEYYDYDCSEVRSYISKEHLLFDPMYQDINDGWLSGTVEEGNVCAQEVPDFARHCPSLSCLITGNTVNDTMMEMCCAWDTLIFLYRDTALYTSNSTQIDRVRIPAAYMSMRQAHQLLQDMQKSSMTLTLYGRVVPYYANLSSYGCWALGVCVAILAAYKSAGSIRKHRWAREQERSYQLTSGEDSNTREKKDKPLNDTPQEEVLELTTQHAIAFIFCSTLGLLLLFYGKIYSIVKILYAIGCTSALHQEVVTPFLHTLVSFLSPNFPHRITIGSIPLLDLLSILTAYSLGLTWLYISFTIPHPDSITFYWIMQDLMGTCICISFLSTMRVNGLKVASVLLSLAFFYDVFMVFITPYLTQGHTSIMVHVATSGGPPKAGPEWCEKYPKDDNCMGGDPLPMLLTMPRFGDYRGGSSLLGLGDIVLPGLLLALAARQDEATKLMGHYSSVRGGYFVPLCVLYAIGLAMADMAVHMTHAGQPALLYLVPCCCGGMMWLAWKKGELKKLWENSVMIREAEEWIEKSNVKVVEGEKTQEDDWRDEPTVAVLPSERGEQV